MFAIPVRTYAPTRERAGGGGGRMNESQEALIVSRSADYWRSWASITSSIVVFLLPLACEPILVVPLDV
jgi:hypothetical protein